MDIYADTILDHYRHPRKKFPLPAGEGQGEGWITHAEKNLSCGDELSISLKMNGDLIDQISWNGNGCAISQAAMSMLAEELTGKNLTDIDALNADSIRTLLNVPISAQRLKCALLCLHTLKNAVHQLRKEPLQGWMETVGE